MVRWKALLILGAVAAAIAGALAVFHGKTNDSRPGLPHADDRSLAEASVDDSQVERLCRHCHNSPAPDTLPRSAWRQSVADMAGLPGYGVNLTRRPPPSAVARWYEQRAPEALTYPKVDTSLDPGPLSLEVRRLSPAGGLSDPVVSNVRIADVLDDAGLELVVCEMRQGGVYLGRPAAGEHTLALAADVPHPAHAEAVDLDRDGLTDLLVANLGSFLPIDHNLGTVEWLRQSPAGRFERVTLADGLGRVADVQPLDFDSDGDLDLVVGEFGWRATGHVLLLVNETSDWSSPRFGTHYVDGRSGAIHVPAADLNHDGRPDFAALLAQEHEAVIAYLNRGEHRYDMRELYRAPHPAWGSSGMQLVDLDLDGDLDVLLTSGDTLDDGLIKPDHGVRWLENRGELAFKPHELAVMYGAHRAEAADLDGDGDLDVAACAFTLWNSAATGRRVSVSMELVGLLWLEQTVPGRFERHNLETGPCTHPTLATGDFDGDGDADIAVGNAAPSGSSVEGWVDLWVNRRIDER